MRSFKGFKDISRYIFKPSRSILTLHRNPDADSVGSNLALARVLKANGHTVSIYSHDPVPQQLDFLPGFNEIILQEEDPNWDDFDVFWALDMSSPDRFVYNRSGNIKTLIIDHHKAKAEWGDESIVDNTAISTCTVLLDLINDLNIMMNKELALQLLVGILGDSTFISNSSVTPKVLADIQFLLEFDINLYDVMQKMTIMKPEDVEFISKALVNIQLIREKNIAIIPIPYEIWSQYGVSVDKSDYLTQYIKKVEGIIVGAIIIEDEPNHVRIRIRSNDPSVDISVVARKLGGDGHPQAAGVQIANISLVNATRKLLESF